MHDLEAVAPAFVAMAHRIVWATAATVDGTNRPRTRILHPLWEWDGSTLTGWIATGPTPVKRENLDHSPFVSLNYWQPSHDTCTADCRATWHLDLRTRAAVWDLFEHGPAPVGYDPAIIPGWDSPESPGFAVLRLEPFRVRVFPGTVLLGQGGEVLHWSDAS
jgi:hypothetical protein